MSVGESRGQVDLPIPTLVLFATAKIIPGFLLFLAIPLWVRAVGQSGYATYSLVWAGSLISTGLTVGWLRQSMLRNSGLLGRRLRHMPKWVLGAAVMAAALPVSLLSLTLSERDTDSATMLVSTSALFATTFGAYSIAQARTQRDLRTIRFNLGELLRVVTSLAVSLSIASWYPGLGAVSILLGLTVGNVVGIAAMGYRTALVEGDSAPLEVGSKLVSEAWNYGWPMAVWLCVGSMVLYSDRFILRHFVTSDELGAYTALADMVVRGIGMASMPITLAIHPIIMRTYNAGRFPEAKLLLRKWSRNLTVLLSVAVATLVVTAPVLIPTLIPNSPISILTVLFVGVGGALWQLALMVHKPLEMANRTRVLLGTILVAWILEITVATLLVPPLGSIGAALGLASGSAAYVALVAAKVRRFERAEANER